MNKNQILAQARIHDRFIEVFTLMIEPSDRDLFEVTNILCDLTPQDLRALRTTVDRLDAALDAIALDRRLKRD